MQQEVSWGVKTVAISPATLQTDISNAFYNVITSHQQPDWKSISELFAELAKYDNKYPTTMKLALEHKAASYGYAFLLPYRV